MSNEIRVHDEGFVQLVDGMPALKLPTENDLGMEEAIVRTARVSYGRKTGNPMDDRKLIRYLYRNEHTSPFESVKFQFLIRAPIFVKNQIVRHRTANFNEFSQRYAQVPEAFFDPSKVASSIRGNNQVNKQSSGILDDTATQNLQTLLETEGRQLLEAQFAFYRKLLEKGMCREVARVYLPMATYTQFYFTIDLKNLIHFLHLRCDPHSQKETREYACAMFELIKPYVPETVHAYESFTLHAMKLSREDVESIVNFELGGKVTSGVKMSKQETDELAKKIRTLCIN
jgi:thymidylate synthase (FAD)